ncbi:MAG: hypothetical protein AAB460_01215 [Patescibacteria group bacterium]
MNELVTRGMLRETFVETFAEFEKRLAVRFDNLEARMELGFSELNERLDAEQAFTSDMWDDFSTRLAAFETKHV